MTTLEDNNSHAEKCPQCGAELPPASKHQLCSSCLMEQALVSRTMPGGEGQAALPPPSPEEIAPKFPQFEILECLGRGGMGVVYKARQKSLNRMVAIKILAPERERDSEFAARFAHEAELLAQLNHPTIVTIHDFGEVDGLYFLVMEFVDGVNLRDVLREEKMSPQEALAVVPSICEALQFAHDQGIVHRDIKPENILLDKQGRVKIADFGIASLAGASTDASGTPQYMAPEQETKSEEADHRADIYALGVVFYEMLTGERPQEDLIAPSKKVEVDVRLDEVVLRALEKEPAKRYQTAGEFQTIVETMVGGTPDRESSKPMGSVAQEPKQKSSWTPTKVVVAVGGCLIALLAVPVIAMVVLWLSFQSRDEARLEEERNAAAAEVRQQEQLSDNSKGKTVNLKHRSGGLSAADRAELQFSGITRVDLMGSAVTEEVLELVANQSDLEWLNLACPLNRTQPQITDGMLASLANCKKLRYLNLAGNPITDEGLKHLASLPNLRRLQLGGAQVTGEGLAHLPQLEWLRLDATPVTDEGLRHLRKMKNLEQVYLDITSISDAGLLHLRGLEKLRSVNLHLTQVTKEGVDALRQARPAVAIGMEDRGVDLSSDDKRFGRLISQTLTESKSLQNCFYDVETRRVLSAPEELVNELRNKGQLGKGLPQVVMISDWARREGVDFWFRYGEEKLILLEGMCIQQTQDFGQLTMRADEVQAASDHLFETMSSSVKPGFHMSCRFSSWSGDGAWVFRTREGSSGVLRVQDLIRFRPGRVNIWCKVIEDPSAVARKGESQTQKLAAGGTSRKSLAGRYRGKLGVRNVEWRIVEVAGAYHWLESPNSKVSESNHLREQDGGYVAEDSRETFKFSPIPGSKNLRFEMWDKVGGKKMGEVELEWVKESVNLSASGPAEGSYQDIAWKFLKAVQKKDLKTMQSFMLVPEKLDENRRQQRLKDLEEIEQAYAEDPKRLTTIAEWYREGGYAVARVLPPKNDEKGHSFYLILGFHLNEWKVVEVNDIRKQNKLPDILKAHLKKEKTTHRPGSTD